MAKNCFIYETLNGVDKLKKERGADGLMRLSGTFGVCGVVNNNRRTYMKENYAKMVRTLQERIQNEGCPGELEHPNSMNITLENVSHKIESISIDENGVVSGTIALLNTPKGKIAQAIVEGGLPLFISSRAQGTVDKNGMVTLEELKTYDLVGTPGFSQARLHLNENQIVESLNENCFLVEEKSNDEPIKENTENNTEIEMTNEEFESRVQALNDKIEKLEEALKSRPTLEQVANGVERWVNEEYTSRIDEWVNDTVIPTIKKDLINNISEGTEKWISNEIAPKIEKWIAEEYSPKVEQWISEEYSDAVEKWINEEYSGAIEKWTVEQFATELQNWIIEELSPEMENWFTAKINESIDNAGSKKIDESDSLAEIDAILEAIKEGDKKPKYSRKEILNENLEANDEPKYIQLMPESKRAEWNMASDDIKESIKRRAKLYNLVNEEAIANFWNKVDIAAVKPVSTVLESMTDVQDEWERNMRMNIRRFRNN